jgi:hypothetical protein
MTVWYNAPATLASFRIIEAAVTVLLDAGFSPQDAANGVDLPRTFRTAYLRLINAVSWRSR